MYDSAALYLAALPLVVWPFTVATAPAALGLVGFGWNKPCSLTRGRRRWIQMVAALLALAQIVGWIFVLVNVWL